MGFRITSYNVCYTKLLRTAKYGNNARKVFADLYVDDRNIHGFPGWMEVYEAVKAKDEQLKLKEAER